MAGNLPNTEKRIVALGYDCLVRAGTSAATPKVLAYVASFEATENFQLAECAVLGYFGPVVIDPQGYNCSITMQGFIPHKKFNTPQYEGGSINILPSLIPSRQKFVSDEGIYKIPYLDFFDKKSREIVASFTGVMIESSSFSGNAQEYVRNNVTFRCLYRNDDGMYSFKNATRLS